MTTSRQRSVLAVLLAASAGIHLAVIGDHTRESVVFGVFFAGVATAQLILAGRVAFRPLAARTRRDVTLLNAGLVALWALSRTAGLPFGPDAGHPEAIFLADAVATALEVAALVVAVIVAASGVPGARPRSGRARLSAVHALGLVAVTAAGFGFASATQPRDGHGHARYVAVDESGRQFHDHHLDGHRRR
jgi:hypothetical protein